MPSIQKIFTLGAIDLSELNFAEIKVGREEKKGNRDNIEVGKKRWGKVGMSCGMVICPFCSRTRLDQA